MPQGITEKIEAMCLKFGLPTDYSPVNVEPMYQALKHDKKRVAK